MSHQRINFQQDFKSFGIPAGSKNEFWKYLPYKNFAFIAHDSDQEGTIEGIKNLRSHFYFDEFQAWKKNIDQVLSEQKGFEHTWILSSTEEPTYKKSLDFQESIIKGIGAHLYITISEESSAPLYFELPSTAKLFLLNIHIEVKKNVSSAPLVLFNKENHGELDYALSLYCDLKEQASFDVVSTVQKTKRFQLFYQADIESKAQHKFYHFNQFVELSKIQGELRINGEKGLASLYNISHLNEEQATDINLEITHNAQSTLSDQLMKSFLENKSKAYIRAHTRMNQNALLSEGEQLIKNLLFDEKAHAISRPGLEVFIDDVKCSHGQATSYINDEELFYLQSRGIDKEKAQHLLTRAFQYEIIQLIEHPSLREWLEERYENA